ncbi:hypothetical protein [Aidingimonas lacisalsi]|nr:hypothetical protein [Aidingimonas lacisalsi]
MVNAFQAAVGDSQRFLPESHIALRQALSVLDTETALPDLVERLLSAE